MFEPWYGQSINDGIGNDQVTIKFRKEYLQNILHDHIPIQKVKQLLDYEVIMASSFLIILQKSVTFLKFLVLNQFPE
jgi:hypothetical protein